MGAERVEVRVREREVGTSEGCEPDVYLRHTYVAERSGCIRTVGCSTQSTGE